jgi:sulfur-carrier protein
MTIHILFFGHYKDHAPNGKLTLNDVPEGSTVANIAALLAAQNPAFTDLLTRTRVAVGAAFVESDMVIKDGDEVAFLPPMSGG